MNTLPAIILAGGRATRMGGADKPLQMVNDQTMLARILDRLSPQSSAIALNINVDPKRYALPDIPILPDSVQGFAGPLAGILAGMDWAAERGADAVISVAGDTPFFPRDLVQRLSAAGSHKPALAASRDPLGQVTLHPVFGYWPVALRNDLRDWLQSGERRVRGFANNHDFQTVIWRIGAFDPFFNVNTPEDLALANKLAAQNPD